ncbi:MAG: FtsH protease activity modulator HflK [Acetatifactor sp.]|nr:FtsH protease activity modulator HflK [Acetatifactor sp.]
MGFGNPQGNFKGSGGKIIGIVAAVMIVALLAFNCAYQIREQEQAVLITLGQAKAITDPGLHFKIPFIQRVKKVNTTIQGFAIGYDVVSNNSESAESLMITSDYNFVNVDFFVEYRFSDPVKAVYASKSPVDILKNVSQSCIRTVIGSYTVDDVLTTGKNEIQAEIKEMIIERLDAQDIGVQLVNITIQDSEPPTAQVMEAFKAVETAKQGKETALNNAHKYRNEQLPLAQAQADNIIQDAEAQKTARINEATGQVARFNAMYEEYIKNPNITRQRMFYETMEDVLPDLKVIIESPNGDMQLFYPMESFTGGFSDEGHSSADDAQN